MQGLPLVGLLQRCHREMASPERGMSKGTPHRPIRISDELWAKAQAKAAQEGITASAKARDLLAAWVEEEE